MESVSVTVQIPLFGTLGIVWTGGTRGLRLGLGLTISLLHGCPGGIDPVEEGADPGVDARDAVTAVPGPIAHDSQQVPGVAVVFNEEAAP